MIFTRSIAEPIRKNQTWEEDWKGDDKGLILAWEKGRSMALQYHELATKAKNGELPILPWRGGVDKPVKIKKYGSFLYLAMWQGLRGEDLHVDMNKELDLTCSKTNVTTTFTSNTSKLSVES